MNISFHYFAVKTIASLAGFCDREAQQIAMYSQFVDDYSAPLHMTCSNIPDKIIQSDVLDLYAPTLRGNFRPVSTGFANPFEYATLIARREQRLILSPFHFTVFDESQGGNPHIRVIPLAFGDGSLIDRLLHKEIADYHKGETRNITLLRMGMLLHIFADSHAHQMFTGYDSQVNRVNIIQVQDNISGEDITPVARAGIRGLFNRAISNIPAIGHVQAGHNPDIPNITFSLTYDSKMIHNRDNTELFLEAGRHVYRYLQLCKGHENGDLCDKLRQGFLAEMPRRNKVSSLAKAWGDIFPDISYSYSSSDIWRGFRSGPLAYSEEFYEYNICAGEILAALYGPKPRR